METLNGTVILAGASLLSAATLLAGRVPVGQDPVHVRLDNQTAVDIDVYRLEDGVEERGLTIPPTMNWSPPGVYPGDVYLLKVDGHIVDEYTATAAPMQDILLDSTWRVTRRKLDEADETTPVGEATRDGDFICRTERVDATRSFENNFVLEDPSGRVIYPGALVYAEALLQGEYNTIPVAGAPIHLTVNAPFVRGSPTIPVENPEYSTVQSAINQMMVQQERGKIEAVTQFDAEEHFSKDQLSIDLGGRVEWGSGSVEGKFGLEKNSQKRRIVARFTQESYKIACNEFNGARNAFATQADYERAFASHRTPMYVSEVKYGRVAYFMLESSKEGMDVEASLEATYNTVVDASLSAETKFKRLKKDDKLKVLFIGGEGRPISSFADFKDLVSQFQELDPTSLGRPIAYTLSFLEDDSIGQVGVTTQYTRRVCQRVTGRYRLKLHSLKCINVSGDEQADDFANGAQELYGTIFVIGAPPPVDFDPTKPDYAKLNTWTQNDQVFSYSVGSEDLPEYIEQEEGEVAVGQDLTGGHRIDEAHDFCVPVESDIEFLIQVVLTEVDDWSANDTFVASRIVKKGSLPIEELRPAHLTIKNGLDELRLYYSIEAVE